MCKMDLNKKVAVITGSARGIGYAIAEEFIEQGATIIITDINQESLDSAVNELNEIGEAFGVKEG